MFSSTNGKYGLVLLWWEAGEGQYWQENPKSGISTKIQGSRNIHH